MIAGFKPEVNNVSVGVLRSNAIPHFGIVELKGFNLGAGNNVVDIKPSVGVKTAHLVLLAADAYLVPTVLIDVELPCYCLTGVLPVCLTDGVVAHLGGACRRCNVGRTVICSVKSDIRLEIGSFTL